MGSLIDSGIFIAAERGKLDLEAFLVEMGAEPFALAAISFAELLQGVERSDQAHRAARSAFVESIADRFEIVPFDAAIARVYSRLTTERHRQGRPLAAHDLMIAATAIQRGDHVVTRDHRSFPTIPEIRVLLR